MTRYFCDGCGQEVSDGRIFVVHIAAVSKVLTDLRDKEPSMLDGKSYHLCERCEYQLRQKADPTQWPRDRDAA